MFGNWFNKRTTSTTQSRGPLTVESLEGRAMMSATTGLVGGVSGGQMIESFSTPAETRTLATIVQAPTDTHATGGYMWTPATGGYMWTPSDARDGVAMQKVAPHSVDQSGGLVVVSRDDPFFVPTGPAGSQIPAAAGHKH